MMKRLLYGLGLLTGCLTHDAMAQSFTIKTVELAHPANGDVEKIGGDLAVSGHSALTRWLTIVDLDDYAARRVEVPPNVQWFSAMTLAGKDEQQIVFLSTEGIETYAPETGTFQRLLNAPSIVRVADTKRLGYRSLAIDINDSGLSDLLIPDFTGYHLYVQQANGDFDHFRLAVDTRVRSWDQHPRYIPRTPYAVDMNLDGHKDWVFVRDGALLVFTQGTDGKFPEKPEVRELPMLISPDNEADIRSGDGREYDGLRIHRVHDILDLDGDARPDMVIRQEAFASAVEQNYTYDIYYGREKEGTLVFDEQPDTRIETEGIQFEPVFTDIDGDGRQDFYTPSAQFGIGTIVRALISGSARVDIEFYLMDDNSQYPEKPNYRHKAKGNVSIGAGRFDLPLVTVADLKGSDRKGLVVGEAGKELSVHAPDKDNLFEPRGTTFTTPLPRDGSRVQVMDVNGDGRDDIVLPFDAQDNPQTRNQVHFLLSQ